MELQKVMTRLQLAQEQLESICVIYEIKKREEEELSSRFAAIFNCNCCSGS